MVEVGLAASAIDSDVYLVGLPHEAAALRDTSRLQGRQTKNLANVPAQRCLSSALFVQRVALVKITCCNVGRAEER